jgi:hypothetical protein
MAQPSSFALATTFRRAFLPTLLVFAAILALFFYKSLTPGFVIFSNDGPLGTMMAECHRVPATLTGGWLDLNTIGIREGGAVPNISTALLLILGPIGLGKVFAPAACLILGLCAWFLFRKLKLSALACTLGAMAAMLNNSFFSAACWGVEGHTISIGMSYLAIGLLMDETSSRRWLRVAVAGLALGIGVGEGADVAALFCIYVAFFAFFHAMVNSALPVPARVVAGLSRISLLALCAALVAAQTVSVLVATSISGVAGAQQDSRSKAERWDWATQWSLPKRETLSLIVPGLFGYRMDTPDGGNYWGAAGRDPAWDRYFASGKQGPEPQGWIRYAGGGMYAGVLVVLVGLWAVAQSFRKQDSVFDLEQRKLLWFLIGTMIVCLLLAYGRFAPFYQFLYALPYFSTIRNPAKFIHILSFGLVIVFAYGLDGLSRRYFSAMASGAKKVWAGANQFDKRWVFGAFGALALCIVGWFVYANSQAKLEDYLQTVQFDQGIAHAVATFSIRQVGWFILFLGAAVILFSMIVSGRFSGPAAKAGMILLGLFMVIDIGRANWPFVRFVDYVEKNATNPVIDFLREKPYEHRVAILPLRPPPQLGLFRDMYDIQWKQHQFQYWNVQALDVVQMPRPPADLMAYEVALIFDTRSPVTISNTLHKFTRHYELTNTRYLLGAAGFLDMLNRDLDPGKGRFRIVQTFNLVPRPGVATATRLEDMTAVVEPGGQYAIFEFTGALPRVKLYSNWQVNTNDSTLLEQLVSPNFDPSQTVLVSDSLPSANSASTNQTSPGTVEYTSYHPKDFVLKAKADQPTILLVNDRFDPERNWHAWVDGKRQPVLRCNYIMRGVQLPAGQHEIEFRFEPPVKPLYVSVVAILAGLGLVGILITGNASAGPGSASSVPIEESAIKPAPRRKPEKVGAAKD